MEDRKPWPWKVETIEFRKRGLTRLEMRMNNSEMSRRVCDMIEAAPDMYEALKNLLQYPNSAAALRIAVEALAKADGNSEAV